MVKVTIDQDHITISGHAGYGAYGKDIVCAAVSGCVLTTINAILKIDETSINLLNKEGHIELMNLKTNKTTDKLVENMLDMLKELETNYPKNIAITRRC